MAPTKAEPIEYFAPNAFEETSEGSPVVTRSDSLLERYDIPGLIALLGLEFLVLLWARWAYVVFSTEYVAPSA